MYLWSTCSFESWHEIGRVDQHYSCLGLCYRTKRNICKLSSRKIFIWLEFHWIDWAAMTKSKQQMIFSNQWIQMTNNQLALFALTILFRDPRTEKFEIKTLPAIIVSSIMTWGLERSIYRRWRTKTIHWWWTTINGLIWQTWFCLNRRNTHQWSTLVNWS